MIKKINCIFPITKGSNYKQYSAGEHHFLSRCIISVPYYYSHVSTLMRFLLLSHVKTCNHYMLHHSRAACVEMLTIILLGTFDALSLYWQRYFKWKGSLA